MTKLILAPGEWDSRCSCDGEGPSDSCNFHECPTRAARHNAQSQQKQRRIGAAVEFRREAEEMDAEAERTAAMDPKRECMAKQNHIHHCRKFAARLRVRADALEARR